MTLRRLHPPKEVEYGDFDLPSLKREQLKWTQLQVQSNGGRLRTHLPKVPDAEDNPFCIERRLRDVLETHELNRVFFK